MNWSLIDFLSHNPWWFVAMWSVLFLLSSILLWQATSEEYDDE